MTRKHFEAIAAAINDSTDDAVLKNPWKCRQTIRETSTAIAQAVAEAVSEFNPNFDRARFLTACDVTDGS